MPTLRDIQRRIRSVQSTQKITRAMKLVAAAKLRRAQDRILAARPYAGKMKELLGNLVAGADGAIHPLLEQREGPRRQVVIVTADKGLAGAFNSNVLRRSLEFIRSRAPRTGQGRVPTSITSMSRIRRRSSAICCRVTSACRCIGR